MNTTSARDQIVDFRKRASNDVMQFTMDLMREESNRLTHEINVGLNPLRMHYEHQGAIGYDIREALDALNVFMRHTKESELNELNKKYAALHTAPLQALYSDFLDGIDLPPGAVRVYRQERQSTQDFPRSRTGGRRPSQRSRRIYQNFGGQR